MSSKYSEFSDEKKSRFRRNALAYYYRHKNTIRIKRKQVRDSDPEFKMKRNLREAKYASTRRKYHLKKCYGITIDEQEEMYRSQDGKCAICQRRFEDITIGKNTLHVDHDHITGEVRQLLCGPCNCAIGNLNEDILIVYRVLEYLKKWKEV